MCARGCCGLVRQRLGCYVTDRTVGSYTPNPAGASTSTLSAPGTPPKGSPMSTQTISPAAGAGAAFLSTDAAPEDVFTREDLSPAQQMFGRIAEDFMRTEVLPRDAGAAFLSTDAAPEDVFTRED